MSHRLLSVAALTVCAAPALAEPPLFQISIPPLVEGGPFTGRLVVYLIAEDAKVDRRLSPIDGPFFDDPQPMFSMRLENVEAGEAFMFKDEAYFPVPLADLPAGRYQAMVVLDRSMTHSAWNKEEGALVSPRRAFDHDPETQPAYVQFQLLNHEIQPIPMLEGVELFETSSTLLTQFRGMPVTLRAGVVYPEDYDPDREYAAVYWIPSFGTVPEFGGDHRDAWLEVHRRTRVPGPPVHPLWRDAFFISLDPQGQFGHHLFADSDNNGPVGRALIEELIPALETKYNLRPEPEARILRGHSSGGWSSIWLAMKYPETFGGAWSSAPDPVDFRAFQLVNIYEDQNMYFDDDGFERPSYRSGGNVLMTIREENRMEYVLGSRFEGAQQWGSWQAVFGTRARDGMPRPLFNIDTGVIDRQVAESFKRFDIGHLVRTNPDKYAPIFRDRIRIVCGEDDNFYLEGAVRKLKAALEEAGAVGGEGYCELVPGADHGSVIIRANQNILMDQMLDHLRDHGFPARP